MQDNQNSGRYFSQEELDAIVSGAVVPKMPTDLGAPQEATGSSPVWDTADTLMAVPRGAVGAAKGVWNFADWATFDLLPDWHTNPLGSSKSIVGGFVEGIAQVGTGMLVGGGVLGAVSKIPGAVGTAASWLGGAGGGAAGVVRSGLSKGAIADFVAFEAHDARLSDLLVQADNPLLNNVVTQYLASDMEDGELEGRLKNALEGGVTGVALDGVVSLLKGSVKASKNYRAAKAAGRSEEEAVKAAMDAGASDIRRGESVLSKEQDNLLTKAEFEQTGGAGAELKEAEELLARADDEASLEVMSAGRAGTQSIEDILQAFNDGDVVDVKRPSTSDAGYPVKRGADAMINRINREVGQAAGITAEEGRFMAQLIERMGVSNFEDIGIRFRKLRPGANGSFDFIRNVINISRKAEATGETKRTFVHEVWHSLTEYLDDSMLSAMKRDYEKAHVAFFDKYGVSPRDAVSGNKQVAKSLAKVIRDNSIDISEWYRLINLDEWVAETLTDASFRQLNLEADTKTVLGFMRYFLKNTLTEIKSVFGGAKYDKLSKDWLNGRYQYAAVDKITKRPHSFRQTARGKEILPGRGALGGQRMAEYRAYGEYVTPDMSGIAFSASRVGDPNYKVDEVRATAVDPNVAKEMRDILAGGGDRAAIRDAVKRYDDAGLINFNRILRGQGTDEELYEELVGVLRQFEANPRSFSKAPKGSNKATSDAAKAALLAMEETGGVNIAAMRAMVEKGTITAKEVFDLAPVLEGVEMHLRSKMLEALRNPSAADPVLMAKAWTSIAGSVEKFFSYAGKTLQVRQAFDTSKRFMDELSRLSPEQRKIMAESMADTLQYLVLDPKTGKEMAKVLTESSMMKGVRIITELHRNSILSGPKTAAVNFWNGVQMLLQPVERAVGRLGSGQTDIAARELSTITRYMGESREAARAAAASFIAEGDSIALGRGNTQFGEFSPQRAVSSRNARFLNTVDPATGGVNRTVAGTAVDFVGQVVGTPTRLMGTSDEFFTTLSARSEADVVLRRIVAKNMKRGLTDSAVSAEVHRLKQIMFVDGQLYTRKTVLERGMRMAREKYLPKALLKTLSDSIAAKTGASATDPSVVSEANRMFSQMIDPSTGKVKSMSEIRKMPDADVLIPSLDAAGGRAVAEPLFLSEVQRFVDQNWDQYVDSDMMPIGGRFQDQVGQDFRILQQASREIERRVRETTWKRDYEDMAESSVWGTRLVGNIGRSVSGAVNQVPALQLVVPFIRTPTNLLAYVTDRNPVGRSLAWVQAARAGDKEAMAEAIGRFSTGTVFYTTAVALAANGMITGKGPKDTELRKQLLAAGWQPYSFRIGDTFLSYGRNDPVATFFGLVADTFEVANATYDPTPDELGAMETLSKAVLTSVANNVTTKSYLRGISTVIEALGGNEAAIGQLKRQYAGAVVPNFLAQGENYVLDSDIRETRTMLDAIRARTPFLNDNVDKVRNATGDPISGAEGPFSMWLPTNARRLSKDPVKRELASSLISVGSPRRVLPGGIDLKNIRLKSGQSAYDRLQELSGEVRIGGRTLKQQLQSLISSPFYQGLPEMGQDNFDSPRVSLVRGNVSSFRRAAMQQLMKESPDLAVAVAKSREAKASMFR
jgi:hypothetical protein